MEKVSQEWLECTCENCRRQVRFKSSEVGASPSVPFATNKPCFASSLLPERSLPERSGCPRGSFLLYPCLQLPCCSLLPFINCNSTPCAKSPREPLLLSCSFSISSLSPLGFYGSSFWFTFSFHSGKCVRPSSRSNSTRGRPSCLPDHLSLFSPPSSPSPPSPLMPPPVDAKYMPKG